MSRKIMALLVLYVLCVSLVVAQQITRFAVVDTARIYSTFFRDSRAVRDFESKRTQFRAEMDRMADEIKNLRQQRVDLEASGDTTRAMRLDAEIQSKTSFLVEFSKARNAELDALRSKLITDDQFYSRLYDEIRRVAESDGYSAVLSLQDGSSIFWYSPTVDITDKIIRNLTQRR